MSHDKIKAAARERMAVTGERYAEARHQVITEHQASGRGLPPGSTKLLWINGPCGVGKTATASELNRRLPGSVVCDPEHVGYGMLRMLPRSLRPRWHRPLRRAPPRCTRNWSGGRRRRRRFRASIERGGRRLPEPAVTLLTGRRHG